MKPIKSAHFDIDGVLITKGDFKSTPPELKKIIAEMRGQSVLFNLASGRPLFEQEELFRIFTGNAEPKPLEGILYEASGVKLWGSGEKYQIGGLTYEQIDQIECFIFQQGLLTGMMPQLNNRKYASLTGYVTPSFRNGRGTDKKLLESKYGVVKPAIEQEFPFAQVEMSADAIDIMAKGVSKDKPTIKYAEITGIELDQTAAIGDSGGDMAMLKVVAQAGGAVAYIGENQAHIGELAGYNGFVRTTKLGPEGAVEFIRAIIEHNKKLI